MPEPVFDLEAVIKRRGFLWRSFDIYGGAAGFYDYGPLGTAMKNNIVRVWRRYFVQREGFAEIETPNIMPEEVFRASGHLDKFNDVMLECSKCHEVFRAEHVINEGYLEITEEINVGSLALEDIGDLITAKGVQCPMCKGEFRPPYEFNLMFSTTIGRNKTGYLQPETAQGIFLNFQSLYSYFRGKMPFGVAQIGKGFRNEVSPRQGVIRLREFNMAEAEVFINPEERHYKGFDKVKDTNFTLLDQHGALHYLTADEAVAEGVIRHQALAYFMALTQGFLIEIGIDEERLRFRQHEKDEMAHYARDCWDAEVLIEINKKESWIECVGIANRSCYDLEQHMKTTGADLRAFERFEEPIEQEVERLKPDLRLLGRTYRNDAPKVREYLGSLSPPFPGRITMELNGGTVEIPKEFYTIEKRVEKVSGRRYIPAVIEPSFGIDRILYAILQHSFHVGKAREGVDSESYTILKLKPEIAPFKAAVFPLFNRAGMSELAKRVYDSLVETEMQVTLDDSGSIGKRYARQDEVGTPYCITVDHQSLEDKTVTIRDRDSTEQVRIRAEKVPEIIHLLVSGGIEFEELRNPESGGSD
ncbi:MAG: glycine--tRNA ligase [Thermoplasmata archaeon]|nr:glycine--tRNA ligase [Thermoplasmata archaeon]